jgi:hypothetical protein
MPLTATSSSIQRRPASAFLEPGTSIYQVNGHPPSEELAVRFNGSLVIYKAMAPPS